MHIFQGYSLNRSCPLLPLLCSSVFLQWSWPAPQLTGRGKKHCLGLPEQGGASQALSQPIAQQVSWLWKKWLSPSVQGHSTNRVDACGSVCRAPSHKTPTPYRKRKINNRISFLMWEYFLQAQDISKLLACEPAQLLQLCLFETPWTVDHQAPLSMGFSRQEYWSGLPFPSRGSFWPRDRTCVSYVSCIGKGVLYHWATWEAQEQWA